MKKKHYYYEVKPTTNQLINIEVKRTRHHAQEHSADALNKLQRAYLELREEWGINFPLTMQDLCHKHNFAESTFSRNFCAGMKSFLSQSEQVLIGRFTEAVRGRGFQKGLYNGFQSLLQPINFSDYNTNRQAGVDMALRTEFCYKVFSMDYWKLVLKPLLPAIDEYLSTVEPRWKNVSDETKIIAYDLFVEEFHWVVGLLVAEYREQLSDAVPDIPLNDYINLYSQFISTTVRIMFSEPLLRDTLFEARMKRIKI